jgi:hypothetical protein
MMTSSIKTEELLTLAAEDLAVYAVANYPGFDFARHLQIVVEKLEAVQRGEIDRLMIFLPPRAGKSMIASQFFPAWYLGRHPDRYVISASYGQELANDFGRKVRNMRRQIARTRAEFAQFSEMSDNRETGWWSKVDLNSQTSS